MEIFTFDKDITVFYVTATSFPAGIMAAHEQLHTYLPLLHERKHFGLSRPEGNEGIVYRAAAEETYPGEAEKFHCETLVLKKGKYASLYVADFVKNFQEIDQAFRQLLQLPGLDPQGYCVEWYLDNTDVRCMIRLEQ